MTTNVLVAVDGGGSKTHLALFEGSGEVLAIVRTGTASPQHLGQDAAVRTLTGLIRGALDEAGLGADVRPDHAALAMHGLDLPEEEENFRALARSMAKDLWVGNDIFAVLRAGTEHGWGVAVGAGSGMNAVGVHPDGTIARFLALGEISGDWGGGWDLGQSAIGAACRAVDGRGPKTALAHAIPKHYQLPGPLEVAIAFHRGDLDRSRVPEAARLVLALADDDVAGAMIDRLATEIADLARAAATRAKLGPAPPVVLSGGLIQSGCPRLIEKVSSTVAAATGSKPTIAAAPPIAGAALIAADRAGLTDRAKRRLSGALADEFAKE